MIQKMGSIKDLIAKMPGLGDMMPPGADIDDNELVRIEAIIQSFTKFERRDPYALIREPTRVTRIAKGSAQPEQQVNELVQKFLFMKQMMGGLGANMGMLGRLPGMKNVAMAKQLRKQMAAGGAGGPGFMGLPGMPGMGMPGLAAGASDGMTKMRVLSAAERNAKKAQRKREKEARRKGRR
jgi:signal recognition particle subunit SRP54